ncbi:MAG: UbiA family prenyltransferase [Gammaproteobacteria bacterium]|nr:UbiA family prenyltransferase [Gammaproteobacteria bacterium]
MKAILQLVRLPAGFSAISNVLAAHLIVTAGAIQAWDLLLSLIASMCLYFAGMGLNDCFDFHEDRANRSNRPLPSGQLTLGIGWAVSLGLLLSGLLVALIIGFKTFLIALLLAAAILLYDSKHLADIHAGPVMGACRYLNWLLAMSVVPFEASFLLIPVPLFFYVSGLTILSTAETGTHSRKPLYLAIAFFVLAFCSVLYLGWEQAAFGGLWLLALLPVSLYYAKVLQPVWRNLRPETVQPAIGRLVMGVIIIDALILLVHGNLWWSVCILLLLLPGKYLARRLYVS